MIVLDLICAQGHRFEGWFASADGFAAQCAAGQVGCPVCNATDVRRVPAAVHFAKAREKAPVARPSQAAAAVVPPITALRELINQVEAHCEDVGARFAEEARRIHYDEAPGRAIRGQATAAQCRELHEEGIAVMALPDLPPERLN